MSTLRSSHSSSRRYAAGLRAAVLVAVGGLVAAVAGSAMLLTGGPAGAKTPPGNNGTVKIVGVLDTHPQNQPHVSCSFSLEWFGFDGGATSTVAFKLQPPTTDGTMAVTGASTVTLNSHGYAVQPYTLTFTGTPHAQQGYHVKLVVTTTGSKGHDTKSKVFWAGPCTVEPTPTVTPTETPTVTPTETPTGTPSVEPPTATTTPGGVAVPGVVESGLVGHSSTQAWGAGLLGVGVIALLGSWVGFLRMRRS